jgi:arylformamidase
MIIYKHYNQEQLNDQYNLRKRVPDYEKYFNRAESLSRETDRHHAMLKDIPYGDHAKERLDIFPSNIPHSKTLVFIHGGYWYLLDKDMFHFLAGHFLKYEVTTILINYPLAPSSSLDEIVFSCRKAVRWIYNNIKSYGGDPEELYLMGHSAGGHLASMVLVEEEAKFVRAIVSLSGLFRLEPVMLSYHNDSIVMDRENAVQNSPVFLDPVRDCPFLLAVGAEETDEFLSQSEELYTCWKNKCSRMELLQIPKYNHYSILDAISESDSTLWAAISRLMHIDS